MNSEIWLTVLLLVFFLILAAGLVALYLSSLKEMKRQALAQSDFLAKTLEIQVTMGEHARISLAETAKKDREFLGQLTAETATRLETNQQQTIKTIDLMATRATAGLQALSLQTSESLRSTLVMLGTKDPLAYQMVSGASPIPGEDPLAPYAGADEVAETQARVAALDEAEQMLRALGIDNAPGAVG